MSTSFRQVVKIANTLEEKGLTPELIQSELLGRGILADIAEAVVLGTVPNRREFQKFLGILPPPIPLLVDYTMSLTKMISAGKYDRKNSNVNNKNFPRTKSGKFTVEVELLQIYRQTYSESVLVEMLKLGFRPATLEELLSFGVTNPEVQREFPVVALGSSCVLDGVRHVPYLSGDNLERDLDLDWFASCWGRGYQFLVVRK